MRQRFPFVVAAGLALLCPVTRGQEAASPKPDAEAPLTLAPSKSLRIPTETSGGEVYIRADRIRGEGNRTVEAEGNVELRSHFESFYADWMTYDLERDEVHARGHVRLRRGPDTVTGPEVTYRRGEATGMFLSPEYAVRDTARGQNVRGAAREFQFTGEDTFTARDATYTSCRAGDDAWYLRVGELEIDRGRDVGTARDASVVFEGVPLLYTPYLSFPLGKERKSGFLTPAFGSTGKRGIEALVPWYWNIAPNYDATIIPRLMTKRGLQVGGQFRYLFPDIVGELDGEYLPRDRVTETDRWLVGVKHNQNFGHGFGGFVNYNRVSDDNYFSDLGERIAKTSQRTLPQEGGFTYSSQNLSALARVQKFQTLQDPNQPIIPPYERVPQIAANAQVYGWHGFDAQAFAEYTDFQHPTLVNGQRYVFYPWTSYSVRGTAYYVTGKVGVHASHYSLDDPTVRDKYIDRVVPITSVDAGVFFERDTEILGRAFVQTLEPRAFYVYIPYREQFQIPSFDTALADFNFAQLFSENRFVGQDRIADANQITLAVTTRLLDAESGEERFRAAIGQRYYFTDQRVTLNEIPQVSNSSDLLLAAGGRLSSEWFVDAGIQYTPADARLERFNAALRYQPAPGRAVSLAYRYSRELVEVNGTLSRINQVDLGAQWPITPNWIGLLRYNYSFYDNRLLEAIVGVEYNADCWVLRVVGHRIATASESATNSFFVQLELNGLSRIGTNPLELLRRNIPGYYQGSAPAAGSATEPVYDPRF